MHTGMSEILTLQPSKKERKFHLNICKIVCVVFGAYQNTTHTFFQPQIKIGLSSTPAVEREIREFIVDVASMRMLRMSSLTPEGETSTWNDVLLLRLPNDRKRTTFYISGGHSVCERFKHVCG